VRAILEARALPLDESQVSLVDERGGLEGVARTLAREVAAREAPEFGVDDGDEAFERGLVAVALGREQLRDILRRVLSHRSLRRRRGGS
jgi:hypothetical protein